MRIFRSIGLQWLFASFACAYCAGCQSTGQGGPTNQATLQRTRQQLTSIDPTTVVGLVIAVESRGLPFAAVGDAPMSEFHEGDVVDFIDSNRKPLTTGVVRRVSDDSAHVGWRKPPDKTRAPQVGDMVVHHRQPMQIIPQPAAPATMPSTLP